METMQFQAESKQLLELMIHSVYSNKEIYLRELISNASDALDKLKFETLTNKEMASSDDLPLEIRIEVDKEKRILAISDTGIGMTRQEVIDNIGTIARSGTRELIEKIKAGENKESLNDMIGQFGIGFYSSFMVADKITILTRRAGTQEATYWESIGDGQFTITDSTKDNYGTIITLHLKPEDSENGIEDYAEFYTISNIVKKYSDFIAYPILMKHEISQVEKDKDGKPKKDGKTETIIEDETLNSMKPIWTRDKSEVTDEEYKEFYKHISHDWNEPFLTTQVKAEGLLEYKALLFIPSKAPFDLFYQGYKSGLHLYVKKVMIVEDFEDLLPTYLRFIKGVVESSDLPLNFSRELLQQDRIINKIKKNLVKKIINALKDVMENDREKYIEFWKEFGNAIKEGVSIDFENKDKLMDLLLYQSSNDPDKLITLKEYIERMKEGQDEIYYFTGDSRIVMESSPQMEVFKDKGIEVLYCVDPVDEIVFQSGMEYEGKKLKSIEKGKIEIGTEKEKKEAQDILKDKEKGYKDLLSYLQAKLEESVKEVRLTNRLTNSPACIVSEENGMSSHLEKLLKQSKISGGAAQMTKKILELNPDHSIVKKMHDLFDKDKKSPVIEDYSRLLMGYAMLSEGIELPNPVEFNSLLVKVMENNLAV